MTNYQFDPFDIMKKKTLVRFFSVRAPHQIPCLLETVSSLQGKDQSNYSPVIILVPRAFTLVTEQSIIFGLKERGIIGTRVFSPQTFAEEIDDLTGRSELEPVTELGQYMLLSQVITKLQKKKELNYYNSAAQKNGLPAKVAQQISEMEDAGLTYNALMDIANNRKTAAGTAAKYHDISVIWREYELAMENKFEDKKKQWRSMLSRVVESGIFENAHFVVYGFAYLNQDISALIATAAEVAKSITVEIVCDEHAPDSHIFEGAASSVLACREYLSSRSVDSVVNPYIPVMNRDEVDPGLRYLERFLYAPANKNEVPDLKNVSLYLARSSYVECLYAAQTLKKWHDAGCSWGEMGVVFCDMDTIPDLLPMVLKVANVPYTMRNGQTIMINGYAQFFLYSIRAACNGMDQDTMIRILKSGYTPISNDDIMLFENYIIEHGVEYQRWNKPFVARNPKNEEYVAHMEELRQMLVNPVTALHDALVSKQHTGRNAAEIIYNYMVGSGAYDKLLKREETLIEHQDMENADKNRQVWDIINDILNQIAVFASETHLSLEDLSMMVDSAVSNAEIRSIPQDADCVQLSDPNMFMHSDVKNLIVMGLQDHESTVQGGLISDVERLSLNKVAKRSVGQSHREKASLSMLGIYHAVALAQKKLLLTCSATKQDGAAIYPSAAFARVSDLVKAQHPENVRGGFEFDDIEPIAPQFALERFAVRLRRAKDYGEDCFSDDAKNDWKGAFARLATDPEWRQRTNMMLKGLNAAVKTDGIRPEQADALYSTKGISISRLESFAACPYKHFVEYGLHPDVRRGFAMQADDRGTFFHLVLQAYMARISKLPNWPNVTDAQIHSVLNEVISEAVVAWKDGPLDVDVAHRMIAYEIIGAVRRTAWAVTKSMQGGKFHPIGTEVGFGKNDHGKSGNIHLPSVLIPLESGKLIELSGQIDRLDEYVSPDGTKYFRVVDYKSSDRELNALQMQNGLQLQIPIYMKAVQNGMQGYVPAGGMYQHVANPLVEAEEDDDADIADKSLRALKMKGMYLATQEIEDAMQGSVKTTSRSNAVIASVSKDQMEAIIDGATETATDLSNKIYKGNADIAPVQCGQRSPCSYCKYASICGIDSRLEGGQVKHIKE